LNGLMIASIFFMHALSRACGGQAPKAAPPFAGSVPLLAPPADRRPFPFWMGYAAQVSRKTRGFCTIGVQYAQTLCEPVCRGKG